MAQARADQRLVLDFMSADIFSSPEAFIKPPGKVYVMHLIGKVKASFGVILESADLW